MCGPLASVDATCKTPWEDCGEASEVRLVYVRTLLLYYNSVLSVYYRAAHKLLLLYTLCTHVSTTGSTDIKIDNVVVENCCAAPCKIERGKNTSFSFTFTPGTHTCDVLPHSFQGNS